MLNRKQLDRLIADNPAVPGGLVTIGASKFADLTETAREAMGLLKRTRGYVRRVALWEGMGYEILEEIDTVLAAWERDDANQNAG